MWNEWGEALGYLVFWFPLNFRGLQNFLFSEDLKQSYKLAAKSDQSFNMPLYLISVGTLLFLTVFVSKQWVSQGGFSTLQDLVLIVCKCLWIPQIFKESSWVAILLLGKKGLGAYQEVSALWLFQTLWCLSLIYTTISQKQYWEYVWLKFLHFLNIKNEYIFLVPYVPYYDLTQKVPMGFGSRLVVF